MNYYSFTTCRNKASGPRGCAPTIRLAKGLLLGITLAASAVLTPPTSVAEDPTDIPVHLFLSPTCSVSRARLAEMSPRLDEIKSHGGNLTFVVIPNNLGPAQLKVARQLLCADRQGRFVPFFLYASRALREDRPIPEGTLLPALGLNGKQFASCMADTRQTGEALIEGHDLFVEKDVQGFPVALVDRKEMVSAKIDTIVLAVEAARQSRAGG